MKFHYLRFSPPSQHSKSSLCSDAMTNSFKCVCSKADQISSSVQKPNGSRFTRSVAPNKNGSCGMIVSFLRKSCNPISLMFRSSITILPKLLSSIRNRPSVKLDFPAPVRPTIPIFSPDLMLNDMSLRAKSSSVRYLTEQSLNSISPLDGQLSSGFVFSISHSAF